MLWQSHLVPLENSTFNDCISEQRSCSDDLPACQTPQDVFTCHISHIHKPSTSHFNPSNSKERFCVSHIFLHSFNPSACRFASCRGLKKKHWKNPIQTFGHLYPFVGTQTVSCLDAFMSLLVNYSSHILQTKCSVLCDKQVRQSSIELARNLPVPPLLTFRMEFDYELSSSLTNTVCDPRSPLPFDMRDSPSNAKANTLNTLQKMSE